MNHNILISEQEYEEYKSLKKFYNDYYEKGLKVHKHLKQKFPEMIKETSNGYEFCEIKREILGIDLRCQSKIDISNPFLIDSYSLSGEIKEILEILELSNILWRR